MNYELSTAVMGESCIIVVVNIGVFELMRPKMQ